MVPTSARRSKTLPNVLASVLLGLVALLAPAFVPAAIAAPDPGTSVYIGSSVHGYAGTSLFSIYLTPPADPTNPGVPDYWAYCIEHDVPALTETGAVVGTSDSFVGENQFAVNPAVQGYVLWVIGHSYPALSLVDLETASGVEGLTVQDAVEATTYAIWRYTDLTFDGAWDWGTGQSEDLYWYLVHGANAAGGLAAPEAVTVDLTGPPGPFVANSIIGPFVVSTNQSSVSLTASSGGELAPARVFIDESGDTIDASAVVDGQEFYLDLRGSNYSAGAATITAAAAGTSANGMVISVPTTPTGTPSPADHAQSMVMVAAAGTNTEAHIDVSWQAAPGPAIDTSLVDAADGDRMLSWDGGTLVDTVTYENLTPGQSYTLEGQLVTEDGGFTGITSSVTFVPTSRSGSVEARFEVPGGWAGQTLIAFQRLVVTGEINPIAYHEDLAAVSQTVVVGEPVPTIGTSLVDAADGDRVLPATGGTVVDTVAYENLTPGVEYTLTGELMRKSDGTPTGITGSATFTPTAGNGTIDVTFDVPSGFAGESLVAFEWLTPAGADAPVAEHTDIDDAAQTVRVEHAATASSLPSTGAETLWSGLAAALVLTAAGIGTIAAHRRARC